MSIDTGLRLWEPRPRLPGRGGLRELAVVLNLVLEVAELLDNLLALGLLLRMVRLGNGAVNVVDGARLSR